MRRQSLRRWSAILACCGVLAVVSLAEAADPPVAPQVDPEADVRLLIEQAEGMLSFGLMERGGSPELADALDLLDEADRLIASEDLTPAVRESLTEQIQATRDDVNHLLRRDGARFYGRFPLARLISPTVFVVKNAMVTEELFWHPAEAAVQRVSQTAIDQVIRFSYPHVVFRSEPINRDLELVALNTFAHASRPITHTRTRLVEALSAEELAAFDRGDIGPEIIEALSDAFHAVNLLVVTIHRGVELPDGQIISLRGDFYVSGQAEPTDNFVHRGFARDRRDQVMPLVLTQFFLLILAVAYSASTRWSRVTPWTMARRILTGTGLYGFGLVATILAAHFLLNVEPDPGATIAAAAWWPAAFGPVIVIAVGFVAWILEAKVSTIMPGAGGERAVGSIFSLTTLGACAWFLGPILLLEQSHGFASFIPFVLATTSLAMLFGFAARTGPPVSSGFMVGPLLLSPLVGVAVFMVSPLALWVLFGLSLVLHAAAVLHYRYAVAHGTAEPEIDDEAAAAADAQKLGKIGDQLKKKLPF